jgi:dihydropteroate synthase
MFSLKDFVLSNICSCKMRCYRMKVCRVWKGMVIKMIIGGKSFPAGEKTYVMGILNVTPDSFSDGGKYTDRGHFLAHAEKMIEEGADIIDVGGESTRPGHIQISAEEEIQRVVPVIRELKKRFDSPVSIDTYKSSVAEAALEAGADLLNDIWGFRADERMAELAAQYDVPVCLMHNRENTEYENYLKEVVEDLEKCLAIAEKHGVKKDKIILDPGVGFGKTYEQNLIIMNHLEDIAAMGYPVLLGTSRKSMIGLTLDLPVSEREEGTIATSVIGAMKGCGYVRVHDVGKNVRALKMTDAILRS